MIRLITAHNSFILLCLIIWHLSAEKSEASTNSCTCSKGDNRGECGMCLELILPSECPTNANLVQRCNNTSSLAIGDLCEADDYECGTDDDANNCNGYDVYKRIACDDDNNNLIVKFPGDNNGECGICLELVSSNDCPSSSDLDKGCTAAEVAIGELCEADGGECGTDNNADNCGADFDIYRRIPCNDNASVLPGDNGGECGICLQIVPTSECPSDPDLSKGCTATEVAIGELCEADGGECGTDNNANNCGADLDVYRRIPCDDSSSFPGDNNGECGICLEAVSVDDCPSTSDLTKGCTANEVAIGELCEADGKECGTDEINNCDGYDIYRRIPCNDGDATAPPLPGDNNGDCGICLEAVSVDECPSSADLTKGCTANEVAVGELCEADGNECGTDEINNCDGYDIYRRISCNEEDATAPPLPGDNDGGCGICLEAVSADDCPSSPDLTKGCTANEVAVGELCEADGNECGTDEINNCDGYDIYRRISCNDEDATAPPLPAPESGICRGPGVCDRTGCYYVRLEVGNLNLYDDVYYFECSNECSFCECVLGGGYIRDESNLCARYRYDWDCYDINNCGDMQCEFTRDECLYGDTSMSGGWPESCSRPEQTMYYDYSIRDDEYEDGLPTYCSHGNLRRRGLLHHQ